MNDSSLNYSNLYIDFDNDNIVNPRLNFINQFKNINIPCFVQKLVTNNNKDSIHKSIKSTHEQQIYYMVFINTTMITQTIF